MERQVKKVISFDLDWVTGDCRRGHGSACAWQCWNCGEYGRAQGTPRRDALKRFGAMRQWLLQQNVISPIVVRDCHADIMNVLTPGDLVLNWDEHSDDDCYSSDPDAEWPLHCGNWVTAARNNRITVQQMNMMPFPEIDTPVRLFIAVSVPYTSPICDEALMEMLAEMGRVDFDLGPIQTGSKVNDPLCSNPD